MITVGIDVHESVLAFGPEDRRALFRRIADAGLDHVTVADHVSFHGGTGFDGMVSAAAALASDDRLDVWISVYQLALRHPLAVARQLASLAQIGPGRLVFGVGVGGEDRSEVSNCGVDPSARGRRLDESLRVLRALESGEAIDHRGEFFELANARIVPAPSARIPFVVGGSSPAAMRRTAAYADGWLAIFCSARRFGTAVSQIAEEAGRLGRRVPGWYGLNVWCGLDRDPQSAREVLGRKMEALYRLPYARFEHLAPAGHPKAVADWLVPYVEAGCRHITLVANAAGWQQAVDCTGEVRQRLIEACG